MELMEFEKKVAKKNNIVFAVVTKTQNYNTQCLAITKYSYDPDRGIFKYLRDEYGGIWQSKHGAEILGKLIAEYKDNGYIIFYGRPVLSFIKYIQDD